MNISVMQHLLLAYLFSVSHCGQVMNQCTLSDYVILTYIFEWSEKMLGIANCVAMVGHTADTWSLHFRAG